MIGRSAILRDHPELIIQYTADLVPMKDPVFQKKRLYDRNFRAISKSDAAGLRHVSDMAILASAYVLFIALTQACVGLLILYLKPYVSLIQLTSLQLGLLFSMFSFGYVLLVGTALWRNRHLWFPTRAIGVSSDGLSIYHGGIPVGLDRHFPWQTVAHIGIVHDVQVARPGKKEALLAITDIKGKSTRLRLSSIRSIEERKVLLEALKTYARRLVDPEDLARMVRASDVQDIPFTQLWSDALRSSIPRCTSSILQAQTSLQHGRFLITKQIGGGGQGALYLAEMLNEIDEKIEVALKEYVLPDQEHLFDRKRAIEQFEREVHLLARLKHPNLARLIDAFIEDHRAYLVLEYLEGKNVRELVKSSGKVSVEHCRDISLQLCEVLSYLHLLDPPVVHLDVSPENVVQLTDGSIRLIDFNTSSDGSGLRTKLVAGKQRYMPPEQYRNEVSQQSDVYSFGCTIYFMLTGLEPEPLSVLHPKEIVPSINNVLDDLVSEATSLDLKTRTNTIDAMKEKLLRLNGGPQLDYGVES
jgi:hypothetical protein